MTKLAANKTVFICAKCDAQFSKWTGRCLECGAWGAINENLVKSDFTSGSRTSKNFTPPVATVSFDQIKIGGEAHLPVGIKEVDRVLGGGLVPGSLVLLGGEPGIGKSSLVLQIAANLGRPVLYVSGEESAEQIKRRLDRLKISAKSLTFLDETNIESIAATLAKERPALTIIDSIQTVQTAAEDSPAGSLNQIKAVAAQMLETAKKNRLTILLIGQVTKDGALAGPRTLEHLVDTVLYLEGDRQHQFRLLRAVKNRFGSTDEVGVFEMTAAGLQEVANPSAAFLSEREEKVPGSVVTCLLEGARPMLVEIQALVSKTNFGYPQRRASGFEVTRLQVLLAVLNRRVKLDLSSYDVHLNVVGGLAAAEPAADLAVTLALASALKDKVLPAGLVAFGEVGLGGEVRSVPQLEKRLQEAKRLGFQYAVVPRAKQPLTLPGLKLAPIANLAEVIKLVLK